MTKISEARRRIRAALQAIEGLDGDLAAGRVAADEHGRRRAEHEREVGRQLASLRQAQSQAAGRPGSDMLATHGGWSTWYRSPLGVAGAGGLLLLAAVGGGVVAGRSFEPGRRVTNPAGAPPVKSRIELQALQPAVVPENAPISALLEMAHGALDQGQLDEARAIYTRILAREPRNVEAVTHLGAVLYREQRVEEAVAKVDEALRIDPKYVHAHWDRTQYLFYGKRDFPAAVRAAEAFVQVAPKGPDADSMRALMSEARARGPEPRNGMRQHLRF
jgi:tetratricopeptide (TPR) repeat protein